MFISESDSSSDSFTKFNFFSDLTNFLTSDILRQNFAPFPDVLSITTLFPFLSKILYRISSKVVENLLTCGYLKSTKSSTFTSLYLDFLILSTFSLILDLVAASFFLTLLSFTSFEFFGTLTCSFVRICLPNKSIHGATPVQPDFGVLLHHWPVANKEQLFYD